MRVEVNHESLNYPEEAINWLSENYEPEDLKSRTFGRATYHLYAKSKNFEWEYRQYTLYRPIDVVIIEDEEVALEFKLRFG